jgi:thiamine-monophosphate kinase
MVRRAGAKPGDRVFVTGTIGDAALGVAVRGGKSKKWKLNDAQRRHLLSRYLLPQPRNGLADVIRGHASAAMDISDGLVGDFSKLCRVSGVAADIDVARVPISDAVKAVVMRDSSALELVLTGGDDYEIVCTVPDEKAESFRAAAKTVAVPIAEIGAIKTGEGAHFLDAAGKQLVFRRTSFSHF